MHHRNCSSIVHSLVPVSFCLIFKCFFCFKYKFLMLWLTIFTNKACFKCIYYWNINPFLISFVIFSAFNRFYWVQMLACLEECLEWCHLFLGSCDDVYIVTFMSCRRRRGKREGAGTGEWCKKMLWLVNIMKSLTLYSLFVQLRPWFLFMNFPLSLPFSQNILHRLSSELWSFTFLF